MFNKDDLFKYLAEDFSNAVIEYRKAKEDTELLKKCFMSQEEEDKISKEYEYRMKSLTVSKDYINITRDEYWGKILSSKIEVIACIGGFELMQEFMNYLSVYKKDNLNLASAFDYHADGIGGWCR